MKSILCRLCSEKLITLIVLNFLCVLYSLKNYNLIKTICMSELLPLFTTIKVHFRANTCTWHEVVFFLRKSTASFSAV